MYAYRLYQIMILWYQQIDFPLLAKIHGQYQFDTFFVRRYINKQLGI